MLVPSQGSAETGTLTNSELSNMLLPPAHCGRRKAQLHTDHWRPWPCLPSLLLCAAQPSPPCSLATPSPLSLAPYLLPQSEFLQLKTPPVCLHPLSQRMSPQLSSVDITRSWLVKQKCRLHPNFLSQSLPLYKLMFKGKGSCLSLRTLVTSPLSTSGWKDFLSFDPKNHFCHWSRGLRVYTCWLPEDRLLCVL